MDVNLLPGTDEKKPAQLTAGKGELWEGVRQQKSLRRGDVVAGTVVSVEREGILVDIGSKSEGIIPPHEMRSLGDKDSNILKPGEEVLVQILRGEDERGQILLSLDRALKHRGWHLLDQYFATGEAIEAQVIASNKGGLIVSYEGVQGFVPNSQVSGNRQGSNSQTGDWQGQKIGKTIKLKILELDRQRNRLIFSEKAVIKEWREQQKAKLLADLKVGQVYQGKVSSIHNFGAFIDLGGLDSLLPTSELSWERGKLPAELLEVGREVSVYVMKIDEEARRVVVSLRRAQPHPWDSVMEKYKVGQLVAGMVTNVVNFGVFVRLDSGIEGLVHISELANRRLSHAGEAVSKGDVLTLKILNIEPEKHQLRLSLRQAQDQVES